MLKTKVGYSENSDAFLSGAETAAMANLGEAGVGLLFTSCVLDQEAVLKGVRSVAGTHVLGCTSSAAICVKDGYLNKETGYTGMMTFGGDVRVGVAGAERSEGPCARGTACRRPSRRSGCREWQRIHKRNKPIRRS